MYMCEYELLTCIINIVILLYNNNIDNTKYITRLWEKNYPYDYCIVVSSLITDFPI